MVTRWYVLWIACFVIAMIREDGTEWVWLILAVLTDAPNIAKQVIDELEI
jgi:hypothetical protein